MNDKEKCLVDISTLSGVSNWLTALPVTEFGFELSKQPFWESIRLRYDWENIQSTNIRTCGRKFNIQHSMSCKKVSFIYIQLNDLTANMMSEVCKDTEIEPMLTPLSGEELQGRTSNNSNEARVDIGTRGFWKRGHFST